MGPSRRSVYDRKWLLLCADLASPVGTAWLLRDSAGAVERIAQQRGRGISCPSPEGAFAESGIVCADKAGGLEWRVYLRQTQRGLVAVEGLAAYDPALRLALASIVEDRVIRKDIEIANLGGSDSLSLVKASAATSDGSRLLGQGYRNNSAGSYAEAAEYFSAAPALFSQSPASSSGTPGAEVHEALINRALQLSDMGTFVQASALFEEATGMAVTDPVQLRLGRNYETIDAINRGQLDQALTILDRPVPAAITPQADQRGLTIDPRTAAGLNTGSSNQMNALLGQPTRLTPQDRARIIDAQAVQLRGTVLRLQGRNAEARAAFTRAYDAAMAVEGGRIVSIDRLRAQILTERALTFEGEGRSSEAQADLRQALDIVVTRYPDSASVNLVRARMAGFLARLGQSDQALALYRQVIDQIVADRGTLVGLENLMRPYFDLLAGDGTDRVVHEPGKVAALFEASQLLEQPGAVDAMTQLSRQLEGGSDEAAALYRRSLGLAREIERTRVAIGRISAEPDQANAQVQLEPLRARLDQLGAAQIEAMSALSSQPRYRAVANRTIGLEELRAVLRPGEGYLKLAEIAGSFFAVYVSPNEAFAWKSAMSAADVDEAVDTLRNSISLTLNGVQATYPFDIDTALRLDNAMFAPAQGSIRSLGHLIFEPSGAFLKLPINLLTSDAKGVSAYHARVAAGGDEYDFTGIDWLGRDRPVSTALSAASFRDARGAPASHAAKGYLGLGNNVPLGAIGEAPKTRSGLASAADDSCSWPADTWNRPISPRELNEAAATFARLDADLMTGARFTDAGIKARSDLDAFRVVHFATHGLVTAPRVGCPVRPALLTSFGDRASGSDGLLSFGEIFDLHLDADLIVLSACDTAAGASLDVTRETGLASGGGQALDGLVRAFIAAGGRQVIASHWPAPDTFDATERLFNGFYRAKNTTLGAALTRSQRSLMDDPETSHPYYWAGFAIVGDASRPVPAG